MQFMEEWGNGRANEYYEANVPPTVHRPKEGDPVRVVEKYIRDKYEHKKYMSKAGVPPPRTGGGAQQVAPSDSGSVVTNASSIDEDADNHGAARTPSPMPTY